MYVANTFLHSIFVNKYYNFQIKWNKWNKNEIKLYKNYEINYRLNIFV